MSSFNILMIDVMRVGLAIVATAWFLFVYPVPASAQGSVHPCGDPGEPVVATWQFYTNMGPNGVAYEEKKKFICYSSHRYYTYTGSSMDEYQCDPNWRNCYRNQTPPYRYTDIRKESGRTNFYYQGGFGSRLASTGTPVKPQSCNWITITLANEAPAVTCQKYKEDGWQTKVTAEDCLVCDPDTGPSLVISMHSHDVNGKYTDLITQFDCPADAATYGSFKDWGYWAGGDWCGARRPAGYWVWKKGSWAVWRKKAN